MISKEFEYNDRDSDITDRTEIDSTSNILTEQDFYLLEERLRIELTQHKVGEIVIRKEIETQLVCVQVPVRREKLIVEQVSPAYKLLAQIDLDRSINSSGESVNAISGDVISVNNDAESTAVEVDALPKNLDRSMTPPTVYGFTNSLKAASELLNAIASLPIQDCESFLIEIVVKDSKHQANYQALVDRYLTT